jgi:O-antigen ligase
VQITATDNCAVQFDAAPYVSRKTRMGIARLLDRTIFYGLLALMAVAAVPYGTVEPGWEALYECGVFAFTILWAIHYQLQDTNRVFGLSLLVPLFALFAFALLQTVPIGFAVGSTVGATQPFSADPFETKRTAFKLLALTFNLGLLLNYAVGRLRFYWLTHVVVTIGLTSALFGLLRQAVTHFAPRIDLPVLAQSSSYAQFINRNHFAFLMEMTLGLVAGFLLAKTRNRKLLVFYALVASVSWMALVLARSRGGLLGMISGAGFFWMLVTAVRSDGPTTQLGFRQHVVRKLQESRAVRIAGALCLLFVLVGGVWWVGGSAIVNRLQDVPAELDTDSVSRQTKTRRSEMWRASLPLIRENWLAGSGFGGYWAAITQYHRASGNFTLYQAHNDYLELAASGGLIGSVCTAWFVFMVFQLSRKRLRQARGKNTYPIICGALAGILAASVHSIVDFGLHITINAVIFIALLVIVMRADSHSTEFPQL